MTTLRFHRLDPNHSRSWVFSGSWSGCNGGGGGGRGRRGGQWRGAPIGSREVGRVPSGALLHCSSFVQGASCVCGRWQAAAAKAATAKGALAEAKGVLAESIVELKASETAATVRSTVFSLRAAPAPLPSLSVLTVVAQLEGKRASLSGALDTRLADLKVIGAIAIGGCL